MTIPIILITDQQGEIWDLQVQDLTHLNKIET